MLRSTSRVTVNVSCPFCRLRPEQIVHANAHALAFRDIYPLTPGHTLVVPKQHATSVFDLPEEAGDALWRLVRAVREQLVRELGAEGFTVGLNDGKAAGQTVGHAHIHVIPRRKGDVPDPRGGIRWVIPERAAYWEAQ
jgi:diadenosine tetraphosphate (Ap4A) HIT family hydrolase